MSHRPLTQEQYLKEFGPTLHYTPPGGFYTGDDYDRIVETHCCFCGQQCGIKLKVKDNAVVGFEPRYDFPFNRGKLCPKGIKRYLQGAHPDRLLHPLRKTEQGYQRISWDEALDSTVRAIQEIQMKYGKDAFAMLSGVSLSTEKSYLIGKFARLALQTANLDYNGRLCMVSAGAGNKKAYGIDRASNHWEDITKAKVIFIIGTNIAECFPVTIIFGARVIMALKSSTLTRAWCQWPALPISFYR